MSGDVFTQVVSELAEQFAIPGVAVGLWAEEREQYACAGVTSVDNPLPVDKDTLFVVGSVTKTVTATAVMRLAADQRIDVEAPVRRYLPELVLADEQSAQQITILNLLSHASGLGWDLLVDTGEGDDALARFVGQLDQLELVAPPGARASYSQAGYSVLGRVIEKVTQTSYERAVADLILGPVGLSHSFFSASDVLTRRFAVGHNPDDTGQLALARLWRGPRNRNPGGGLASSAADQIRWARFHLGDGRAANGERILPTAELRRMQQPVAELHGSSLGDAIGVSWFLRDIDGASTVGHAGSANGQFAEMLTVPGRDFAVVSSANSGPNGIPFNQAVVRWALEHYLDVRDRDPEPLPYEAGRAKELAGRYDVDVMTLHVADNGTTITLAASIKPEIRASFEGEMPPDYPPATVGLLPGDGDHYIVTEGGLIGSRGYFTRDNQGRVVGLDLAGRIFERVEASETNIR